LPRVEPAAPPPALAPFEPIALQRRDRGGTLGGWYFPAAGPARGTVLFLHPWMEWGSAYFFRRERLQAVRRAGYDACAVDLSGFGRSAAPAGFYDRDVVDALAALVERGAPAPLHIWGVSSGGYWSHVALSSRGGVAGAFFEDVAAHLFEWSWRQMPQWRAGFTVFRWIFPEFYRWLDVRRHAAHLRLGAVAYASGERDRGVRPEDTRALAAAAGGDFHLVAGAGHLEGIKRDPDALIALALSTFERAVSG
jgi:pimeloyl-ACP methyl ester carboxylesterase